MTLFINLRFIPNYHIPFSLKLFRINPDNYFNLLLKLWRLFLRFDISLSVNKKRTGKIMDPVKSSTTPTPIKFESTPSKAQDESKCKSVALNQLEIQRTSSYNQDKTSIQEWPLSENGVPTINNLQLFTDLAKTSKDQQKRTVLDEMLTQPRPRNNNSTTQELRKATMEQIQAIMNEGMITIEQLDDRFDHPDTLDFIKKLGLLNPSAATLLGVHSVLFGRSLKQLGTEKHWMAYLEKSNRLEIFGCCLMTEMGHGSNVPGLETTATYDRNTREFILNTPTLPAHKAFIGGAAENANYGVVFANLVLNGEKLGVHAFIVELRRNGQNLPGITTLDMGRKEGLNGIDNGYVKFDHVRIPYDNFLDRHAEISLEGSYIKKKGNKDSQTLIYRLMSQFVRGRQIIALNVTNSLMFLSTVFGCYPPNIPKTIHNHFMVKLLSKTLALEFAKPIYLGKNVEDHIAASFMKAIASEMAMECFDEILFKYGHSPHTCQVTNVILDYRADLDATLTYEGDNFVLLQMTARDILKRVYQDYQDLIRLKPAAIKKAFCHLFPPPYDPYHLMQRRVLELAKEIGNKLSPAKGDANQVMEIWNSKCQLDIIDMSRMSAQTLILKEFYKKAKQLDEEQNTKKWSMLYTIYAWETCSSFMNMRDIQKPNLTELYNALSPDVYTFFQHFDVKLEWLHALIPKPTQSFPYQKFQTGPYIKPFQDFPRSAL